MNRLCFEYGLGVEDEFPLERDKIPSKTETPAQTCGHKTDEPAAPSNDTKPEAANSPDGTHRDNLYGNAISAVLRRP